MNEAFVFVDLGADGDNNTTSATNGNSNNIIARHVSSQSADDTNGSEAKGKIYHRCILELVKALWRRVMWKE